MRRGGLSLQLESIAAYILIQQAQFVPPTIDTGPTITQFYGTAHNAMAGDISLHIIFEDGKPAGFFAHRLRKVWKKWAPCMKYGHKMAGYIKEFLEKPLPDLWEEHKCKPIVKHQGGEREGYQEEEEEEEAWTGYPTPFFSPHRGRS